MIEEWFCASRTPIKFPCAREATAKLERIHQNTLDLARKPLAAFEAENPKLCTSENLKEARVMALNLVSVLSPKSATAHKRNTGATILDVADSARNAKCTQDARVLYDHVIKVFVGSDFAALRQRAEIGINDVRALAR